MNTRTLIGRTLFLSASHFFVRLLGFVLRIWLSRELGAQAMGLVELAGSAQMLLASPVISGLPAAVSRMCAKSTKQRQVRILRCAIALALLVSLPLTVAAFVLREPLALWLGDIKTLPALLCSLPCIPVLGVSCVLNGYYYGTGRPAPPAVCEIVEQIVRILFTVRLTALLRGWPEPLHACAPAAASFLGETAALALMLLIALRVLLLGKAQGSRRSALREMIALALPLTGMRLTSSLMRTAQSALLPARLELSGLSSAQALAQLGMMSGMLMPVLMIPSFVTCSLCMAVQPEITRRQSEGKPQRRLIARLLRMTLLIGVAAMLGVLFLAPLLAETLYRQPQLLPLIRRCSPLIPAMALTQVASGLMNALGMQGTSLRIALWSSFAAVLLMYVLAALPQLRLYGALIAIAASQVITLFFSMRALRRAVS